MRTRSLRRLKWSAVLLPTLFIWWSETIRHHFFDDAPIWLGNLITATVAFLGSYVFAQLLFRLIEGVDAAVVARNRRLATLYALAAVANRPSDEAALLHASLPIIRSVFSAESVMFVISEPSQREPAAQYYPLTHNETTLGWLVDPRDALRAGCVPPRGDCRGAFRRHREPAADRGDGATGDP